MQNKNVFGPGFSRRQFCKATALAPLAWSLLPGKAMAYPKNQPALELVAQSPTHLWNAIVITSTGRMFAGMPRWPGFDVTPSVVEIKPDGKLVPYPGADWNDWAPGKPANKSFVNINALHCADGVTLWAIDQGAALGVGSDPSSASAQKLVQIDTRTDKVVRVLSFGEDIMPKKAAFNDIRLRGDWAYLTESGMGAIIVVNLRTGRALRRLGDDPSTKQQRPKLGRDNRQMIMPNGEPQVTNADPIELSPDGKWLYYQPASGPLYRVPTAALRDESVTEAALHKAVEYVYDTGTLGGTAIDDKGNLFLAEADHPRVSVLAPDGTLRTLIEDDRLCGADAMIISHDRYLYMPISQVPNLQFLQGPGGKDLVTLPFKIWRTKLPDRYGGPVAT